MQTIKLIQTLFAKQPIIRLLVMISVYLVSVQSLQSQEKKSLLYWANALVDHLNAANTDYRHKDTKVSWPVDGGDNAYQSYTDCSGLINALLQRTYQIDDDAFKTWLGKTRPLAYQYFDAVESGRHFKKIETVTAIMPGDILFIKYADRSEHEDNTGHCMLVAAVPKLRVSTPIDEPGLDQYEVMVIDASKSPHGKSDTRYTSSGDPFAGTGKGLFRLYADKNGMVKGYSWSTGHPKADFDPLANPIAVGRIDW